MTGQITIDPLLPLPVLAAAAAAALVLLAVVAFRRGRGVAWRALALLVLFAALVDPKLIEEERSERADVALVVVDQSPSQRQGDRERVTAAAVDALTGALAGLDRVETRVVRVGASGETGETRLFEAVEHAIGDDAGGRLGAVFMVTDGQVHDAPPAPPPWLQSPLHVLISGRPDERDRRLTVERMPAYGMVGTTVEARIRVDELGESGGGAPIAVRVSIDGEPVSRLTVQPGVAAPFAFPLTHAGATVVEFAVDAAPEEISTVNNRAAAVVNGVRDRLKVLLISGQPHAGERAWRNLLKSDPGVDLVHFTILRPPDKDDATPLKELSLIVFPVQELFETKLDDFDLIVFDRYAMRGVLPLPYYDRIADYVRRGGALLLAVGPEYAGHQGLWHTPLGEVLPAVPTGRIIEKGFRPRVTELGHRHPVTSGLPGERHVGDAENDGEEPTWGQWFRFIEATPTDGASTLLQAPDGRPLLVVERVDQGRVALLLSDQIWMWSRGFEGGGPHGELLRRLGHWLMKEPELEEESLTATATNGRLAIVGRSLAPGDREVTVTSPSGREEHVRLDGGPDGIARSEVPTPEAGLWRVNDGTRTALAASGQLNPREFADVRATDTILAPLAHGTGGGIAWLPAGDRGTAEIRLPDIRRVGVDAAASGDGWLGIRRNGAYTVTGVHQVSLLPGLAVLALVLALLGTAWWREGR